MPVQEVRTYPSPRANPLSLGWSRIALAHAPGSDPNFSGRTSAACFSAGPCWSAGNSRIRRRIRFTASSTLAGVVPVTEKSAHNCRTEAVTARRFRSPDATRRVVRAGRTSSEFGTRRTTGVNREMKSVVSKASSAATRFDSPYFLTNLARSLRTSPSTAWSTRSTGEGVPSWRSVLTLGHAPRSGVSRARPQGSGTRPYAKTEHGASHRSGRRLARFGCRNSSET